MNTILRLKTGPAIEPVTLTEAKAFVRQDESADDPTLSMLIGAARSYVEMATGRALVEQTWQTIIPEWPREFSDPDESYAPVIPSSVAASSVEIVKLPFIAVQAVTVGGLAYAAYTTTRTVRGFRVTPTGLAPSGETIIEFKAGYGATATDVPADLRLAMLKLIATCYDNPGVGSFDMAGVASRAEALPGFMDTLSRYRVIV